MKLVKPLRDRMLVLPEQQRDDVTSSGVVVLKRTGIHDSQAQLGIKCTVIEIGADVDRDQVKPGDTVLIGEFEYAKLDQYLVIQDKDIVGVLQ
jgi:co-chaperonin GroES (HSP10)